MSHLAICLLALTVAAQTPGGSDQTPKPPDEKGGSPSDDAALQQKAETRIKQVTALNTNSEKNVTYPPDLKEKLGKLKDDQFDRALAIMKYKNPDGTVEPRSMDWAISVANGDADRRGFWKKFSGDWVSGDNPGHGLGRKKYSQEDMSGDSPGLGHGHRFRHNKFADTDEKGQPVEASIPPQSLRAVGSDSPGYGAAQAALAVQEQKRGNNRAALSGFQTAISAGQDDSRTLTFAALSALNAGEPKKAYNWSATALQEDPGGPLSSQATAINRMAIKHLPKEEDPKAPIRGSDAPEPAAPARGATANAAAAAASIPELERPIQPRAATAGLPPEALAVVADTNRLMALASKAYRAGDMKEAVKLSAETLAKDPDDVRALQVSAAAHAKEGKWEEVRKEAEKGLDLAPGYVPLLLLRSASAIQVKDWRSAKADAAAVLAKEKANPTAWRFMGIAQSGLGEREESVTSLSNAVQYGDPEARRLLALARALPPGADAADLVEMLANAADGLETASAARAAAPPPAGRRLKTAVVFAAAVLTGIVVGGLIFLAGRSETESS